MTETPAPTLDLRTLVPRGRGLVLLVLVGLAGFGTWAAFPPLGQSGLAWVAPALLMLALSQLTLRQGFLAGWLYGTILMGGVISFVAHYGALPWILLAVVMGLFYGLFGLAGAALRGAPPVARALALASAWFLCEYLRGHVGSLSLTFGDLAYSQFDNLPLIQPAVFVGHYGVSFLMALLAAALSCVLPALLPLTWLRPVPMGGDVTALRRYNRDAGRLALGCFGLLIVVYGVGRLVSGTGATASAAATGPRVAVVQAEGTPGSDRSDRLSDYLQLSTQQPARLIVWPETAVGVPLNTSRVRREQLAELARKQRAFLLVGASEITNRRTFNSAYFITPEGRIADIYRKVDLVMFGEYVPGRERFPFVSRYPIRRFDYTAGSGRKVFTVDGFTLAPLICFEGIFPDQTRDVCRRGAQVVVIITSDAWAPAPYELRMHSAIAPFRAIEARKYLVRAASTGQSAICDPYGNIVAQVPCFEDGVAAAVVQPRGGLSAYHQHGDVPLLVFSVLALLVGLFRSRQGSFVIRT